MDSVTDSQVDAAIARGKREQEPEPRAAAARYDRQLDRAIVDLTSGYTFAFPPRIVQGLKQADPDQLAEIELLGRGCGLHWETMHVDLSLPGLTGRHLWYEVLYGTLGRPGDLAGKGGSSTRERREGWTPAQVRAHLTAGRGARPRPFSPHRPPRPPARGRDGGLPRHRVSRRPAQP